MNDSNARTRLFTGGLHTVINENNLILAFVRPRFLLTSQAMRWWYHAPNLMTASYKRFCHTQLNAEVEEMLTGLKRRFTLLGVADPEMAIVDNCCHVKNAFRRVFPDIAVLLDVWHFLMR